MERSMERSMGHLMDHSMDHSMGHSMEPAEEARVTSTAFWPVCPSSEATAAQLSGHADEAFEVAFDEAFDGAVHEACIGAFDGSIRCKVR